MGYRPTIEDDMSFALIVGLLEDPTASDEQHVRSVLRELGHFMADLGQDGASMGAERLAAAFGPDVDLVEDVQWFKDKSEEVLEHLGLKPDPDTDYDLESVVARDWIEIPEDVDRDKIVAAIKRQQKKNQA